MSSNRKPPDTPTLFNVDAYTKPITFFDLDNRDTEVEDFPPTGKNRAYTVGMKVGQVIKLADGKQGLVIAIINERYVRAYFPDDGESSKVCADDFEVVPSLRVHFGGETSEKRTLTETPKSRTLSDLSTAISHLPLSDLHELKAIVEGLIQAMEEPEEATNERNHRGHFEFKLINGYGPYRYLRYWSGGKHRSVYLGK